MLVESKSAYIFIWPLSLYKKSISLYQMSEHWFQLTRNKISNIFGERIYLEAMSEEKKRRRRSILRKQATASKALFKALLPRLYFGSRWELDPRVKWSFLRDSLRHKTSRRLNDLNNADLRQQLAGMIDPIYLLLRIIISFPCLLININSTNQSLFFPFIHKECLAFFEKLKQIFKKKRKTSVNKRNKRHFPFLLLGEIPKTRQKGKYLELDSRRSFFP